METEAPPAKLTRRELYDRVWTTPVIRVAEDLGVTSFVLTNLCRKHAIATPPSGYWSKVAHGKPVNQPNLGGDPDAVVDIGKARVPGCRASKSVLGRISRQTMVVKPIADPGAASPQAKATLHQAIQKTVDRLNRAGKERARISGAGCFTVFATETVSDRVAVVLETLVIGVEARGWRIRKTDKRLEFDVDGESIGFELIELTDRVRHQPTEQELAAKAKYEARVAHAAKTGAYVSTWDAPKIAEWEHIPNGKLSLALAEGARYFGIRRTFSDRKTQRVETLIDCVIEALAGYAAAMKERRAEQERARVLAEQRQREHERLQRLQKLEQRRVEFAERQIARLERIERFSALLARLGDGPLPADADRFREWLRLYRSALEDDFSGDRLEARLASTRLMHDDANLNAWIDVETGGYRSSV